MTAWILTTERLRLRRLEAADRPALARLDWLDADRVLQRCLDDYGRFGHALWVVEQLRDGAFVGLCGLLRQQLEGVAELEVGYHLLPEYRGRGLASEAARGVMAYAFERLGADRIISIILPDNAASIGVARRNGLAYERPARFRGLDVVIYAARRPARAEASDPR